MKLITAFILGMFVLLTFSSRAQSDNLECENLKFQAEQALIINRRRKAITYLLEAEKLCNGLNHDDWNKLIETIQFVIGHDDIGMNDAQFYIDTLIAIFDRQEAAGIYDSRYDLERGTYYIYETFENREKAEFFIQRGIRSNGPNTPAEYLLIAYYLTYDKFLNSVEVEKNRLKEQLITDYLTYSKILEPKDPENKFGEVLNQYFHLIVKSCDDLLPSVPNFIDSLPKDTMAAIERIEQMAALIEQEGCEESSQYLDLIDTWLALDSNSVHAQFIKDRNSKTTEEWIGTMIEKTDDPKLKAELQYKIAYYQYKAGKYLAAHNSGKACTGEYKSKGLLIAAQSVAALAPSSSCGNSTFERKCNYIYAAQLADEAGQGRTAEVFRSKAPQGDCMAELAPLTLSCWGVTVYVCR